MDRGLPPVSHHQITKDALKQQNFELFRCCTARGCLHSVSIASKPSFTIASGRHYHNSKNHKKSQCIHIHHPYSIINAATSTALTTPQDGAIATSALALNMIRLRPAAVVLLLVGTIYFAPLLLISHGGSLSVDSSGQWEQQQAETLLEHRLRRLQQNDFSGSTVPPKFTQLDRAAETQRIYRAVAEER